MMNLVETVPKKEKMKEKSDCDPSDLSWDPLWGPHPQAVNHSCSVCSFAWALLNDQKSCSKLKVTCMSVTSDLIFSWTCNYLPGANRKCRRRSAWLHLLPPHHCLKVNPEHVNSLQPIPLFLLPLSSFTTNSASIMPNCCGGQDWANSC